MEAATVSIGRRTSIASKIEKERLHLGSCRRVLRLLRLKYENGRPQSYERIVLPLYRLPALDVQLASTASLSEIAERHGLKLGRATEHIRLVDVPSEAALHLAVGEDQKVLELDRVTTTADGVPIEWRVVFMLS